MAQLGWLDGEGPFGGSATGPNPTDRAKRGRKRSLLTDGGGIPLGLAIAGAHVHDKKLVERTGSWLNRFRKLLVSFEKTEETALALLHFACAYITLRRALTPIGGS